MPRKRTIPRVCLHCEREFWVSSNHPNVLYCSGECRRAGVLRSLERLCLQCGEPFRVLPLQLERGRGKFCSRRCQARYNFWIDGSTYRNGYRVVTVDGQQRYEHRVVMERMIGRPLRSDEHVHHMDDDRLNNNPSNLMLVSRAEHNRLHKLLH